MNEVHVCLPRSLPKKAICLLSAVKSNPCIKKTSRSDFTGLTRLLFINNRPIDVAARARFVPASETVVSSAYNIYYSLVSLLAPFVPINHTCAAPNREEQS